MEEIQSSIILDQVESEPLGEYVIDYLTFQKRESPFLDFKKIIHVSKDSNFPELAKDIFSFSNYGGGWILIGWEEYPKNQFVPVGLPEEYEVEPAVLQEKFNSFSNEEIALDYKEFNRNFSNYFFHSKEEVKEKVNSISNRFAVIFIPPSHVLLKPKKVGKYKKGEKTRIVFKENDIFYRRGTQSIKPSRYELKIIKKRLENENYRLSLLMGEPDELEETIYSNLFEITNLPKYVYYGNQKIFDSSSIKIILKNEGVFPEFFYKFKEWNKRIVTFENLMDENNPYRKLVDIKSINKEKIENWLDKPDKFRVIKEILNREIKHLAILKGIHYFTEKNKLYYPTEKNELRKIKWKSRYGQSTRQVVGKMYIQKFNRYVYWHVAVHPSILDFNNKFYLRLLPTFIITFSGKHPISNQLTGTIITQLSYSRYNSKYLNTVFFWIHQLGEGKDIKIKDYLQISSEPVELKSSIGILHDAPSSEFKLDIGEDEYPFEDDEVGL